MLGLAHLLLDALQLDVVEIGLHLEVKLLVVVHDEGPDARIVVPISRCDEEVLREDVLLGLGRHYHSAEA
jgi:hypothetical protein